nr:hypothetical protein Iba_chr10fCG9090 [Ipomoea batatas]
MEVVELGQKQAMMKERSSGETFENGGGTAGNGGDTPSVCRNALEKEVGQGPNEKQAQEENNVTPCSLEKAIGVQQVDNTPLAKPVKKVLITGSRETEDTPKGKGSRAAGKFIEEFSMALEAIIQGSMGKKERKGKESGLGSEKSGAAHASVKGVSERNSKGEVREFKNSMDWVRVVEEFMKKDKLLDQKVKEAMKEINEYLWTVYDKEKEEYTEEGRNRAMKAATIFLVKVKHCPSWGSENGLLGEVANVLQLVWVAADLNNTTCNWKGRGRDVLLQHGCCYGFA